MTAPCPPPPRLEAHGDLVATLQVPARILEGEGRIRVRQVSGVPLTELVLSLPANQGQPESERLAFPRPDKAWGTRLQALSLDGHNLPLAADDQPWAWRLPLARPLRLGKSHELRFRFTTHLASGPRPSGSWPDGGVGLLGAHPELLAPAPCGGWPAAPGGAWAPPAPGLPMRWQGRLNLPPGWQGAGPGQKAGDGSWTVTGLPGLAWVAGPLWQVGESPAQGAGPTVRWVAPPALADAAASLALQAATAGPALAKRMGAPAEDTLLLATGSASPWGLAMGPGWAVAPEVAVALAANGGPDSGLRWVATRGLAGAWWASPILNPEGQVVAWGSVLSAWAAAEAWEEGEGEAWGWAPAEQQIPPWAMGTYRALRLKPQEAQAAAAWRWSVLGLNAGLDKSPQALGPGAAMALMEAWGPSRMAAWAKQVGPQVARQSLLGLAGPLRQGPIALGQAQAAFAVAGADALLPWTPSQGRMAGMGPWAAAAGPPPLGMSPGVVGTGLGRDMNRAFAVGWRDGSPVASLAGGIRTPGNEAGRLQAAFALRPEGLAVNTSVVGAWAPRWGSAMAWRPYVGLTRRPIAVNEGVFAGALGLQLDEGTELVDLRPARRMMRAELELGQGQSSLAPGAWLEANRTWPWGGAGALALRAVAAGRWGSKPGDGFRLDREAGFRRADVGGATAMVALQGEALVPLGDSIGLPKGLGWVVPQGLLQGGLGWAGSLHPEAGLGMRMSLLGWGSPLSVQLEWTPVGPGGFSFSAWNTRFGHAW